MDTRGGSLAACSSADITIFLKLGGRYERREKTDLTVVLLCCCMCVESESGFALPESSGRESGMFGSDKA